MRTMYYGVKNLNNGKVENIGCYSKWHNAAKKAELRLEELKTLNPHNEYKVITFMGRI